MTEEVAEVLKGKGFKVRERGRVYVKGKGVMVTFLLSAGSNSTGGIINWLMGNILLLNNNNDFVPAV